MDKWLLPAPAPGSTHQHCPASPAGRIFQRNIFNLAKHHRHGYTEEYIAYVNAAFKSTAISRAGMISSYELGVGDKARLNPTLKNNAQKRRRSLYAISADDRI